VGDDTEELGFKVFYVFVFVFVFVFVLVFW